MLMMIRVSPRAALSASLLLLLVVLFSVETQATTAGELPDGSKCDDPTGVVTNSTTTTTTTPATATNGTQYLTLFGSPLLNKDMIASSISVAFVTSAFGAIFFVTRFVWEQFMSTFLMTVTISNKDDIFEWLLKWMANRSTSALSAQRMSVILQREKKKYFWSPDRPDVKPKIVFQPGAGNHMFTYKGRYMWMTRYAEGNPIASGWNSKPFKFESITLSAFGRSRSIFMELFDEALEEGFDERKGETKIYNLDRWGDSWEVSQSKPARSYDSVVLDQDVSQTIKEDAIKFLHGEEWYRFRGIPHRRGYLLYGPPGTGKTSFVQALAGELKLNIAYLSLSSKNLSDEGLAAALNAAPLNCVILLEDVDAVFVDRNTAEEGPRGVSFSGLLNAIDGVSAQEGRLFFMSTNHIERLDPALIRPGRCDVKVKISYASRHQVIHLFRRFYPSEPDLALRAADLIPQNTASMASLQGLFLQHRDEPLAALAAIPQFLKDASEGHSSAATTRLSDWLRRLALSQYLPLFEQWQYYHVSDIKNLDPLGLLCPQLGIKNICHMQRIADMLAGKEDAKKGFTLANRADIKSVFERFYPHQPVLRDAFADAVPIETVSVFQVEAHCANYPESPDEAIARVSELLENCPPLHALIKESVPGFLSRMGVPSARKAETVAQWLARHGIEEVPAKFTENGVVDMDTVCEKFDGSMLKDYGIEKDGVRWRLEADLEVQKFTRVIAKVAKAGIVDINQLMEMGDSDFQAFGVHDRGLRWAIVQELARIKERQERDKLRYEQLLKVVAQTPRPGSARGSSSSFPDL